MAHPSSSSRSPVLFGVPQGTVFGPTLFLLFVNDVPDRVASGIKMFAVDCVIFRNINSPEDHALLQSDLNSLEACANDWQMSFVPKECMVMSISLKRSLSCHKYCICGVPLESVKYQKYLGVYVSYSLNWSKQHAEVKKKASRVLGGLQRNLSSCSKAVKQRAYLALVRPTLEPGYATPAWSPHTQKDINNIESVQRRAARFVRDDYRRTSSVNEMIKALH